MQKDFVNSGMFQFLVWLSVIGVIALLIGSVTWMVPAPVKVDLSGLATKSDLNALDLNVEIPEQDTAKINRVCELTEGCEYWEPGNTEGYGDLSYNEVLLELNNGADDFFDSMVKLTGIDEDNLVIQSPIEIYNNRDRDNNRIYDSQIRVYSDKDAKDDNWEVKTFIKVKYYDSDEADIFTHEDAEYLYIVVTSVLDEGDYDSLIVEEVTRSFEFE